MDEIGSAPVPDDDWVPEERPLTWGHPATSAVTAAALAWLAATGSAVTNGVFYVLPLAQAFGAVGSGRGLVVTSALLSVAFALLPLLVAVRGLRLLVPSDTAWIGPVLRAAVVVALIALALRGVGLVGALDHGALPGELGFFGYGSDVRLGG